MIQQKPRSHAAMKFSAKIFHFWLTETIAVHANASNYSIAQKDLFFLFWVWILFTSWSFIPLIDKLWLEIKSTNWHHLDGLLASLMMVDLVDVSLFAVTLEVRKSFAHVPNLAIPVELGEFFRKVEVDGKDTSEDFPFSWKKFLKSASSKLGNKNIYSKKVQSHYTRFPNFHARI